MLQPRRWRFDGAFAVAYDWYLQFQEKHVSLTPLTGYVIQSSSPSTVVVSSRTTERHPEGVERQRVMWEGAEKQGECERKDSETPRATARQKSAPEKSARGKSASEREKKEKWRWENRKRADNSYQAVNEEPAEFRALIWFNHHEIRALRRRARQRQHRCRHARRLSAWSWEHWCFPLLEVRTL